MMGSENGLAANVLCYKTPEDDPQSVHSQCVVHNTTVNITVLYFMGLRIEVIKCDHSKLHIKK